MNPIVQVVGTVLILIALLSPIIYLLLPMKYKIKIGKALGLDRIPNIKEIDRTKNVTCPICQSSQISANPRGYSLLTGFIGSGTVYITCLRCGHKWKAGKS